MVNAAKLTRGNETVATVTPQQQPLMIPVTTPDYLLEETIGNNVIRYRAIGHLPVLLSSLPAEVKT